MLTQPLRDCGQRLQARVCGLPGLSAQNAAARGQRGGETLSPRGSGFVWLHLACSPWSWSSSDMGLRVVAVVTWEAIESPMSALQPCD